jgi:hypothetical protein
MVINQLSAAIAEGSSKYFYTQSCTEKQFYGVCKLKNWINSPEFINKILELVELMAQACVVQLYASGWKLQRFICSIAKNPERPFGKVKNFGGDMSIRVKRAMLVTSIACCGLMTLMRMKQLIEYKDQSQN